jgi:hypothetical protein
MAVIGKNLISSSLLATDPPKLTDLFDSDQAVFPTRRVPISKVVDLLHVAYNHELIKQYHDAMQRGECFPPISVIHVGNIYLIADGHKRFKAYMQFPFDEITVEVWTLRRWMLDQWHQFTRRNSQIAISLVKSPVNADARMKIIALTKSTLAHWKRVAISLFTSSRKI